MGAFLFSLDVLWRAEPGLGVFWLSVSWLAVFWLAAPSASGWTYRPPRSSDATPATADSPAATLRTTTRPWWNGCEIRLGKNVRPVRTRWLAAGSEASAPCAASRCCTGLTPRTVANSDDTGGRVAIWWAMACGTSCCSRPRVSVRGRLAASPAISSEKNTPIDRAVPEFWNVERIPEAAPRWRAGTLPMMDEEFGAPNMPLPIPFAVMSTAKAQYEKLAGRNSRPMKLPPNTTIPAVAIPREPNRSDRIPAVGPEIRKQAVSGGRKMPAHSGVRLKS